VRNTNNAVNKQQIDVISLQLLRRRGLWQIALVNPRQIFHSGFSLPRELHNSPCSSHRDLSALFGVLKTPRHQMAKVF
jgi:hypothetical protein